MKKILSTLAVVCGLLLSLSAANYQNGEPEEEVTSVTVVRECTEYISSQVELEAKVLLPYTSEEIDLIALITMAEAEGECEYGQRLVIDTILNRLDSERFPDTVSEVVYQKNQFSCVSDGRADRCYVRDDIRDLVEEELVSRTNTDVLFFRADHYGQYGTPAFSVQNHYFSM